MARVLRWGGNAVAAAAVLMLVAAAVIWTLSSQKLRGAKVAAVHLATPTAVVIALGFANPAQVDTFPVREFAWSSDDGASWLTGPPGDLEGGIVDDAVRFGDRIIATGRGWTTAATGTWEAPFAPAVWILGP